MKPDGVHATSNGRLDGVHTTLRVLFWLFFVTDKPRNFWQMLAEPWGSAEPRLKFTALYTIPNRNPNPNFNPLPNPCPNFVATSVDPHIRRSAFYHRL